MTSDAYELNQLLSEAVRNRDLERMKILLDLEGDPETLIDDSWNALKYAVFWDFTDGAKLLLNKGANPNATYAAGRSVLHEATERGNIEIIKALLEKRADINARTRSGITPLHKASWVDQTLLLIEKGADVKAADNDGWTVLHKAAALFPPEVVQVIIGKGADVNARQNDGKTPLHYAAENEKPETIKLLLANKAEIGARDKEGNTPLHVACKSDCSEAAKLLLTRGAECDVRNDYGFTPLRMAVVSSNVSIVKLLLEKGANASARFFLSKAAAQERLEEAQKTRIDAETQGDFPLLHLATQGEHIEIVAALLEAGADIHATYEDPKNGTCTVLHQAQQHKTPDILELLLKKGADLRKGPAFCDWSPPLLGTVIRHLISENHINELLALSDEYYNHMNREQQEVCDSLFSRCARYRTASPTRSKWDRFAGSGGHHGL